MNNNELGDTPKDPNFLTYPEIDAIYKELNRLKRSFSPNPKRRDRAEVMIGACILLRFNTAYLIRKSLNSIGLSGNYVLKVLDERTGPIFGEHLWLRDEAGRYHLLDEA